MSAQANLAGLFAPKAEEIWNKNILWQPIPVHTVPRVLDHVLAAKKPCPKYMQAFDDYVKKSAEVQRIYTEYAPLFKYWSEMSGENIETILQAYWLYDTLQIEQYRNKTLVNAIGRNILFSLIWLLHLFQIGTVGARSN